MSNAVKRIVFGAGLLLCASVPAAQEAACIQWDAPQPDVARPDAGLDILPDVEHYTIFPGSQELGMFNHGPMVRFFNGRLFVTWFSHDKYEGAAGTRMLFSFSKDLRTWSEPTVLFDSIGPMAEKGIPGTGIYGGFEEVNGRLYSVAQVKEIVQWNKEKTLVPVHKDVGLIARRIHDDGTFGALRFWLADQIPEGYENEGILSCLQAEDDATREDLIALKKIREDRSRRYSFPEIEDEGVAFCEPTYFIRSDGKEVGVYRDLSRSMRLYAALRDPKTDKWSIAKKTNIPDSPSKTASGVLPDGSVFLVGNFLDKLWQRDPLLFVRSRDGIHFDQAGVLRAGAAYPRERHAGDHKGQGFQYPNATVTEDSVWVTYSISKEQIAISRIPLRVLGADGKPALDF